MAKRLIVAEKPSVGRDIAKVLNCRENRAGCCVGDNDIVTWAVGHLVGLCYPDEIDPKYEEWKLEDLPIFPDPFPLKVLESGKKQFEIVKELMNSPETDRIVCATDAGREGELIFRYICQMAGCTKPVERLWISSLTYRAIKEGFEHLRPSSDYDHLYESARCRSEADWLIGMNGSRAFAIENDMHRLAVGRVLSPTLSILVQRELERRNFIPEEYCEVIAKFDGYEGRLINQEREDSTDWSYFPISEKERFEEYAKTHSSEGIVASCSYEESSQPAPQLYDLTSLQRDANRMYGMSSKRTLDMAQSLYEKRKAITYPRTDSRYLSSDLKSTFEKRLNSLHSEELDPFITLALASQKDLFGRFINNHGVSDHHAMIPTGEAKEKDSWSSDEKKIYDLISRRFLGMFLEDREYIRQTIRTEADGYAFLSYGEKEVIPGWSAVDHSRKKDAKIQELPILKQGDSVSISSMRVRRDNTKPPASHTEASLLAAMEHAGKIIAEDSQEDRETEFGIGTPATRAATIEKMIDKGMAKRKNRALIPTEYGIALIRILPEVLQSPSLTGQWEARLSRMNRGEESPERFMKDIRELTRDVISHAVQQGDTGIKNANSLGQCPLCGSPVYESEKTYYCRNRDCDFRIFKAAKNSHPTLDPNTMRELLETGTAATVKGTYRIGKEKPYLVFTYAEKQKPDYKALSALINDYGFFPVNKVPSGGALWIPGERDDELLRDFVRDAQEIGCHFDFFPDSKALKHRCGYCHRVEPEYKAAFEKCFPSEEKQTVSSEPAEEPLPDSNEDPILNLVQNSGFEYSDKRANGGSLWIIASEEEGKELIEQCRKLGVSFAFSPNGGKASKKRPAWYSLKSSR